MKRFSDAFLAVTVMVFIISAAVIITLEFRPLYYWDIKNLNIAEESGYTEEEIRENYDVLIDYNVSPFQKKLQFPSLPMSEAGEIHFREVKEIFQIFLKLFIGSGILVLVGAAVKHRKKEFAYLKWASVITIAIPAVVGVMVGVFWEKTFVLFHNIMFDNDYWLFDPETDPVINILPDEFFMHCAVMIIAIAAIGAAVCFGLWKRKSRKTGS